MIARILRTFALPTADSDGGSRPYPLLRNVSVASLISILLATAVIAFWHQRIEIRDYIQAGELRNLAFAGVISNSLHDDYLPLLRREESGGAQADAAFAVDLDRHIAGTDVIKLRLYDAAGTIVFSTEPREIGQSRREHPRFQAAHAGSVSSDLEAKELSDGITQKRIQVLETYVPIRRKGDDEVIGVFEIYTDLTTVIDTAARQTRLLAAAIVLTMCGLYLLLFFIVRNADWIIRVQTRQRAHYVRQLKQAKQQLEARVAERTRELHTSYAALQESEEKFRSISASLQDGVFLLDHRGMISYANPVVERLFGYRVEELLGKPVHDALAPERVRDGVRNSFSHFCEAGSGRMVGNVTEVVAQHRSGREFPVELSVSAVKIDGRWCAVGAVRDITERKRVEEELRHLATHDPLTGLANRALLDDRLVHTISLAKRKNDSVVVVLLDLDQFKLINDNSGHKAGDDLLITVSQRLLEALRDYDTVARTGGDEFVVLIGDVRDLHEIDKLCAKIKEAVQRPILVDGSELRVTCSMGVSVFPDHGQDPVTLLKHADIAMYRAKERGRDNWQVYTHEMGRGISEKATLRGQLEQAIKGGDLLLHYQPVIELASGRIVATEALVRWSHLERGVIGPVDFIMLAEETGLINELGKWVLNAACAQLRAWKDLGIADVPVAINLSLRQLSGGGIVGETKAALERHGLTPGALQMELTESILMESPDEAARILQQIKDLGVGIAIDDFGTGYSSLAQLRRFPIDKLKIDRSFIKGLSDGKDAETIANTIIGMGQTLGLAVVAEGVESEPQLEFLRRSGCDQIQGFYFSAPVDADQITKELLRERGLRGYVA